MEHTLKGTCKQYEKVISLQHLIYSYLKLWFIKCTGRSNMCRDLHENHQWKFVLQVNIHISQMYTLVSLYCKHKYMYAKVITPQIS
jgi:hypothetical protein